MHKGTRRKTLVAMLKMTKSISDDDIALINKYFFEPEKPWSEIEEEVLSIKDQIDF
jgi:hypothetical protein